MGLTFAFVLLGGAFAVMTPVFQQPDEPAHVDMARYRLHHPLAIPGPSLRWRHATQAAVAMAGLNRGGAIDWTRAPATRPAYPPFRSFPGAEADARPGDGWCSTLPWPPGETCQNYHYGHPPTYYALMAPLTAATESRPFPQQLLALRLAGVLLTAAMVPFTWLAAREVWPASPTRPLAAGAFVAFAGPLAAAGAAVNNDALMLACAGATVAATARVLRRPDARGALLLGVATGAGLLAKSEFLVLAPIAAAAVLLGVRRVDRGQRRRFVLSFAVPAAAGSVWWLRTLAVYHALSPSGSEIVRPPADGPWRHVGIVPYALEHGWRLLRNVWGSYGWNTTNVPDGWRLLLNTGTVVLAVAWLATRRWRRPTADGLRLLLLAAFPAALTLGALWTSWDLHTTNGEIRGFAGRYVYAAAPVFAIAAAGALGAVAARLRRWRPVRRGALLAGGAAVWALVAGAGSFVLAAHGLYASRSWGTVFDRAHVVAPVAPAGTAVATLALVWFAVLVTLAGVMTATFGTGYRRTAATSRAYASGAAARKASA